MHDSQVFQSAAHIVPKQMCSDLQTGKHHFGNDPIWQQAYQHKLQLAADMLYLLLQACEGQVFSPTQCLIIPC